MKKRNCQYLGISLLLFLLLSGCKEAKELGAEMTGLLESQVMGTEQMESFGYFSEEAPDDILQPATLAELAEAELAKDEPVESTSRDCYAYRTLNDEEKQVYDQIYYVLSGHIKTVTVNTLDIDVLDKAYRAVMADHGEIFWTQGYSYTQYLQNEKLVSIDLAPDYTMTQEERATLQEQINDKVGKILSGIDAEATDYEKAKYVFDYLATNVEYCTDAQNNQNIISVFLQKETVCQGYANAMQYLLGQLGIQAVVVTGTAEGQPHAWNLVQLDGEYYYMDVTWGNSSYTGVGGEIGKFVDYHYFAVTSEELSDTHIPDGFLTLPECTATADSYFIHEGKYFSEWQEEEIGALMTAAYQEEAEVLSIKFTTTELYEQAVNFFIIEQHITDYCEGLESLQYLEDKEGLVLTIKF